MRMRHWFEGALVCVGVLCCFEEGLFADVDDLMGSEGVDIVFWIFGEVATAFLIATARAEDRGRVELKAKRK